MNLKRFCTQGAALIAFLISFGQIMYAQTTVQIGTGNSYTSDYYPFRAYFDFSVSNIIYKASEINTSGSITKIAFFVNNSSASVTMNNQKIYAKHTTANSYSSATYPGTSGYTLVFNGTITYSGSGWKEIIFDTPFQYDGQNNLEFLFENHDGSYVSTGIPYFMLTTNLGENRIRRDYRDGIFPSSCNYCATVNAIVNIKITLSDCSFSAGTVSASPSNVVPGGSSTISISGQDAGAAIQWFSSMDNVNFTTISGATGTSYNTPALTSTAYYKAQLVKNGCYKYTNVATVNIDTSGLTTSAIGNGTAQYDKYIGNYLYDYSWSSIIYKASEINSTGKLTHLSYYVDNNSSATANNQKIYVRHTDQNEYPDASYPTTTGFTLVYDGSITFNGAPGWKEIALTNLFEYNGVQNLEILVANHDGSYTLDYPIFRGESGKPEYRVKRDYKDNSFPGTTCNYCARYKNILNIKIKFLPCNINAGTITAEKNPVQAGQSVNLTLSGQAAGSTIQWQKSTDNINYTSISGATNTTYSENMSAVPVWFRTVATNGCSKFSNALKVNPDTCFNTTVTIGDSAYITEKVPFNNYYNYSYSNIIYTANEVGGAGKINSIAFYVNDLPATYTANNQKVYVRHTQATGFTNNTYPGTTGFTLVYDGSITYSSTGWLTIPFTTLFDFDGTSNLELLMENYDGSYTSSYPTFRYTTGYATARTRRDFNDVNFPVSCYLCNRFTYAPNIKITRQQDGSNLGAGEDVSICAGNSILLQANGGVSYSWSPATGLSATNIANPVASPAATATYTVSITSVAGCLFTDSVTVDITVPSDLVINTTGLDTLLSGDTIKYTITGAGISATNRTGSIINYQSSGFSPEGTANIELAFYGVSNSTDQTIFKFDFGCAGTISNVSILENDTLNPLDSAFFTTIGSELVLMNSSGAYHVETMPVKPVLEDGLLMTPNADGLFDTFVIDGLEEISVFALLITDTYGNTIFQTTSKTVFWDGKNSGNETVPVGAYNYLMQLDNYVMEGQFLVEY